MSKRRPSVSPAAPVPDFPRIVECVRADGEHWHVQRLDRGRVRVLGIEPALGYVDVAAEAGAGTTVGEAIALAKQPAEWLPIRAGRATR